ncbi:MAG: branched-chain-amino-acid transaminase [bacterium]|jgi:branched-chain amino acid aminotransferase
MTIVENPNLKVYFNGRIVPAAEAGISVFDHGLLYGDGVFEGIRSYNGAVFRLDEHLDRLYDSARYLSLDIGMAKNEMEAAVLETLAANDLYGNAYIRLVVTRGPGDLGINPNKCTGGATVFIITADIQLYPRFFYENGLRVVTLAVPQKPVVGLSPMVKSLNYVNNILGMIQVNNYNAWTGGRSFTSLSDEEKMLLVSEGIMISREGYVTEATADNVFVVKNGVLSTPDVNEGILPGITRNSVLEIADELGIETRERRLTVFDLYGADECFLTGTAAELVAVRDIDGRTIGDGINSFEVYRSLKEAFPGYVARHGTPIPRPAATKG